MNIVLPRDQSLHNWVAARMPDAVQFADHDIAIGVEKEGTVLAGAVYHDHQPDYRNIQVSFATDGPGWASRKTVAALLWPAFRELDCQRVTALIRKKNKPSRKLVEKLGFRYEGGIWRGYGNDHMIVYGLRDVDAKKWLERYDG